MEIEQIISELTLDEKLRLLTGEDNWGTIPVERLGIPKVVVSDGPHGLRKLQEGGLGISWQEQVPAMAYPTYASVSATWNPSLAKAMGSAIAEECIENNVDVLLGPGTNMKRHPLCGRNFEYFSEDPYLAGQFAAAFIQGVQEKGVGTSLKHYAANNQETDRLWISSEMDERTLREIYLPAFEEAVKKAMPWTVMCSYNKLNGTHASQNKYLLNDILREEWGFDGTVISDWFAVHDRAAALKATLDLQMPFTPEAYPNLEKALEENRITMEEIDCGVADVLKLVERCMEAAPFKAMLREELEAQPKEERVARRMALGRSIAEESIALLKNEGEVLPLKKDTCKKIAVVGGFAKFPVMGGGGSANVTPVKVDTPLDEIVRAAGTDFEVQYAAAYNMFGGGGALTPVENVGQALEIAYDADVVLVFAADTAEMETEGADRRTMRLTEEQEHVIAQISEVNPNVVVVMQTGSAIDVSEWESNVRAIVWQGYTGGAGAGALADILFGLVSPSGKITESYPICIEDTPAYGLYPGSGTVSWYQEGLFIGYRYYDSFHQEVAYPFGHGLSYTEFAYANMTVEPSDTHVTVAFDVTNVGGMEGKETVQVYVRDVIASVLRPEKELKGFAKVSLKPGETKRVQIALDERAFSYYDSNCRDWVTEAGAFEILVGSSSRDIRLVGKYKKA